MTNASLRFVYAGMLSAGDTCEMRRRALEQLGHQTVPVNLYSVLDAYARWHRRAQWRLRGGPMITHYNEAIRSAARPGMTAAWIDKGLFVTRDTLLSLRRRGLRWLVHYSPDNYALAQNTSRHLQRALAEYDMVVTTKPDAVDLLSRQGARRVLLSHNAFDPLLHRPVALTAAERTRFGADVVFVGRWEPDRERLLDRVAAAGTDLAIWGPGWDRSTHPRVRRCYRGNQAMAGDYTKAICGARIALGLLSDIAGDTITQRSIEIPACGTLMLAPRTVAHAEAFDEGVEADFFSSEGELVDKIRWYLEDTERRHAVAAAGRRRCVNGGYSYAERQRAIVDALTGAVAGRAA